MRESYDRKVAYEQTRYELPIDEILSWDDYGSWGQWEPGELRGLSRDELSDELTKFRGSEWADRAMEWLEEGIPAVVVAQSRDASAIADGRGRVSLAVGLGIQRLPVIILREIRKRRAR